MAAKRKISFGTLLGIDLLQKVRAAVVQSAFRHHNVKSSRLKALLEVRLLKKCTALLRKTRVKIKRLKAPSDRFWMLRCRKVHGVIARNIFQKYHIWITFGCSNAIFRGMCKGFYTFIKRVGLEGFTKTHFA